MRPFTRPFLSAALVVALAAFAPTLAGTNNLTQIGIAQHSGGPDTLRQIGIALHDGGTYLAGDGSVRTIPGDGSVRLISIGGGTQEAFCFHNVSRRSARSRMERAIRFSWARTSDWRWYRPPHPAWRRCAASSMAPRTR